MDPTEKPDSTALDTCIRCGHKFACTCGSHNSIETASKSVNYLNLTPDINYTNFLEPQPPHKEPTPSAPHLVVAESLASSARYTITVTEPEYKITDWQIPWYEIVEQLEDGTFCHVLKARRDGFDKFFVVKVLKSQFAKNPRMAKRFELEARKVAEMDHANIAAVYDVGKTEKELPYFVCDFIEGEQLSSAVAKQGFLPEAEAVEIFLQICDALIHAHANKCIHRSLKPDNVFLTKKIDGSIKVKVTDAGIARVIPIPENDKVYAAAEEIFGDARYLSPEQCRRERLDERSDVYSLGCLMYQILGGKAPFDASKAADIRQKQISEDAVALSKRFPDLDFTPKLDKVVMHALVKNKAHRYQSIADVKKDLLAVKELWKEPGSRSHKVSPTLAGYQPAQNPLPRLFVLLAVMATIFGMIVPHLLPPNITHVPTNIPSELSTFQPPPDAPPAAPRPKPLVLYYIKDSHGKTLYSAIGPSLGKVLEQAVKHGANLTGANLTGESLNDLDLHGARLRNAQFYTAKLANANFKGADLRGAQFSNVAMTNVNLDKAQMEGTIVTDSDLTGSRLVDADLKNSFFRDCELNSTKLKGANFSGASVFQCQLPEESVANARGLVVQDRFPAAVKKFTIMSRDGKVLYKSSVNTTFIATVQTAVRSGVSLENADLRAADLNGANLLGAKLKRADLRGALLTGADLSAANIEDALCQGVELGEPADDVSFRGLSGGEVLHQPEPTPQPNAVERIDDPPAATDENSSTQEQ